MKIGLIGSGYMGRGHALAYRAAASIFDLPIQPELELLADIDAATAERAAASLGFRRSTGDWRELVEDDAIELVDITSPNHLHEEMALAAAAAGKHIYCEKPLAPTAAGARRMVDAAAAAGIRTMTGFNYLKNPITSLAKEIIETGEIGEVFSFRGWHFEDYMADPNTLVQPWRFDPSTGDGVTADLGSHIISLARHLVGPIDAVAADRDIVIPDRGFGEVRVADQFRSMLRFAGGAKGSVEASWMAPGRKMAIGCEIWGSNGSLWFDFERLNELHLYTGSQVRGREGFRLIQAGPAHKDFANFVPAPGHQLGFNDLKTIEVRDLMEGLVPSQPAPWPDFQEAWEVQRVVDAVVTSAGAGAWVAVVDH